VIVLQLLLAGVLGGVVGATELGARYRDDPAAALRTLPGLLYAVVNAMAAVAALVIVKAFGWTFGLGSDASSLQVDVVQILVAGVGSAALFRSSLFTVRQGDQEIAIGPSALLTGLLGLVDRAVDRRRALERLKRDDLAGLSFDRDHVALTELCTGALQNLDKADAQALGELAARLKDQPDLSDPAKLDCFALKLLTLVGPKAVQAAAQRLRERNAGEQSKPVIPAKSAAAPLAIKPAPVDEAGDLGQAGDWRERLNILAPLVERPVLASGPLDAALEMAWLHERLKEYQKAQELNEELATAVRTLSPPLTDHELVIALSRVQMTQMAQHGGYLRQEMADQIHDRLIRLCSHPGGGLDSYAVALSMLARLPQSTDDEAVGYLTGALELLSIRQHVPYRDFSSMLHSLRACLYLALGKAKAAADDLVFASESENRELQIISISLSSLLQRDLTDDQTLALNRVLKPFGFSSFAEQVERTEFESRWAGEQVKDEDGMLLSWYISLAKGLVKYFPDLVRDTPLRTFDLMRSGETWPPESGLPLLASDTANNPITKTFVGSVESAESAHHSASTHRDEIGLPDVSA
jgi:hypothetical protein